jgi:hypothetical protein
MSQLFVIQDNVIATLDATYDVLMLMQESMRTRLEELFNAYTLPLVSMWKDEQLKATHRPDRTVAQPRLLGVRRVCSSWCGPQLQPWSALCLPAYP